MSRMEKIKSGTHLREWEKLFTIPRKPRKKQYPVRTAYEWDLEIVSMEGEAIDHIFVDRLKDLQTHGEYGVHETGHLGIDIEEGPFFFWLVLVRSQEEGPREWAYLNSDGTFPEEFDGGSRVPKRFLQEFERHREWASKYVCQYDLDDLG